MHAYGVAMPEYLQAINFRKAAVVRSYGDFCAHSEANLSMSRFPVSKAGHFYTEICCVCEDDAGSKWPVDVPVMVEWRGVDDTGNASGPWEGSTQPIRDMDINVTIRKWPSGLSSSAWEGSVARESARLRAIAWAFFRGEEAGLRALNPEDVDADEADAHTNESPSWRYFSTYSEAAEFARVASANLGVSVKVVVDKNDPDWWAVCVPRMIEP